MDEKFEKPSKQKHQSLPSSFVAVLSTVRNDLNRANARTRQEILDGRNSKNRYVSWLHFVRHQTIMELTHSSHCYC